MIVALIITLSLLVYFACYVVVAGKWYQHIRPYTEPLACDNYSQYHQHSGYCYRRPGMYVDNNTEAISYAMMLGLAGPIGVLGIGLIHFIKKFAHDTPEERAVRNERRIRELEQENNDLRRKLR